MNIIDGSQKKSIDGAQQKNSCPPKIKSFFSISDPKRNTLFIDHPHKISFSPFTVRGGKLMESPLKIHYKSTKAISTTSAVGRPASGMTAFERPAGATVLA
jgi:hypothetical protein